VSVTIQGADAADNGLLEWCLERDYASQEQLERATHQGLVLVARERETHVGLLRGSWLHEVVPMLALVWVEGRSRRMGIAAALLDAWCRQLSSAGHPFLLSSSTDGESLSAAWHASCGFERCGEIRDYNEDGSDELLYRLRLSDRSAAGPSA